MMPPPKTPAGNLPHEEPMSWGQAILRFLVISAILAVAAFVALVVYASYFWEIEVGL